MLPPQGYSKAAPHQVCKLTKSLYGLKEASRQWNKALTKFLTATLGFSQSSHDFSLNTPLLSLSLPSFMSMTFYSPALPLQKLIMSNMP